MQFSDMQGRLLERLGENSSNPAYYQSSDAAAWLNATQRLFVLLTLCLETTGTLILNPTSSDETVTFYSMLSEFYDWLLPLRVRVAAGLKLAPSRLADLAALDANWVVSPGPVSRYALLGFDLLAVYQQPLAAVSINITYARCPDAMVNPGDNPQIPEEYHPALIDGAIPLMRAREGGSEWKKTMPLWDRFLDAAQKMGEYVRARNQEQGYDHLPVELRRFDRSKLLMKEAARVA
jgi:hypothetical protein